MLAQMGFWSWFIVIAIIAAVIIFISFILSTPAPAPSPLPPFNPVPTQTVRTADVGDTVPEPPAVPGFSSSSYTVAVPGEATYDVQANSQGYPVSNGNASIGISPNVAVGSGANIAIAIPAVIASVPSYISTGTSTQANNKSAYPQNSNATGFTTRTATRVLMGSVGLQSRSLLFQNRNVRENTVSGSIVMTLALPNTSTDASYQSNKLVIAVIEGETVYATREECDQIFGAINSGDVDMGLASTHSTTFTPATPCG